MTSQKSSDLDYNTPLVSVVMACYREPLDWFQLAVNSILTQSLSKLELIVVIDDPKNEELISYLNSQLAQDKRLIVIINEKNLGLPDSLNIGIRQAKAPLIARMDADDIAAPNRLSKQFEYMQAHPEVSLLGTAIDNIDENGESLGVTEYKQSFTLIKKIIPYCSVACHPTWMFKLSTFNKVGMYRALQGAEDYDLLYRIIDANELITNLPDVCLKYRVHNSSITSGMNLKRYKIRQYIKAMHKQRQNAGQDDYNRSQLDSILAKQNDSVLVGGLLTKLRKAEAEGSKSKIVYLGLLCCCSRDIRTRIVEHLKLYWTIRKHRI